MSSQLCLSSFCFLLETPLGVNLFAVRAHPFISLICVAHSADANVTKVTS